MKQYKICLIHNTHTDVGFTGTQEEIELQHYDYLLQAVNILESGKYPGFAWQCENTWLIDNFYEYADENEKRLLEKWIRTGKIGLSGHYLNVTELADAQTMDYWANHARAYADKIGVKSLSAMSCDIDGYSWGLADALSRNGYRYFLGSIHTHHGMYPMFKCPSCFWWEGPEGGKILTFISEHYNLGNELGICPHSMASYSLHDRYSYNLEFTMFKTDAETTEKEELEASAYRVSKYLEGLEKSGYPFEYVPVLVSGGYTDNGAPNPDIARRVETLNRLLEGKTHIEMTVLDDFFQKLEDTGAEIPCYKGDFPDWWEYGIGSLGNSVRLYREGQRAMRQIRKLDAEGSFMKDDVLMQAMKKSVLFAEHTWSYCATVFNPWSIQNKAVELKNAAYAAEYHSAATRALMRVQRAMGGKQPYVNRKPAWTIVNPNSEAGVFPVGLTVDAWEFVEGCRINPNMYELRDEKTGCALPVQVGPTPRGPSYNTVVALEGKEQKTLVLTRKAPASDLIDHNQTVATDYIRDIYAGESTVMASDIETKYFSVKTRRGEGVVSIYDKTLGRELLEEGGISAFAGVRDITPVSGDNGMARKMARKNMGRNQAAFSTKRQIARLENAEITENGSVYACLELTYRLEGVNHYIVRLKVYKDHPVITADVIMSLAGGLEPESLYISLPFARTKDTYIGKAGCVMRPGVDQLPGTCQAFYAVHDGIVCQNDDSDVLITMEDVPLVRFGLPEPEPVMLFGKQDDCVGRKPIFAWALNNYWETNFPCNIAGDYQFRMTVMTAKHADAAEQMQKIKDFSDGAVVLRK